MGVVHLSSPYGARPNGALTSWADAGFFVSAERRAASGTLGGGDFYALAVRGPGRIGVIVGDACGRGAEGAIQRAKILPKVHELALSGASPATLLAELNRFAASRLTTDRFVTAAAFELDLPARRLTVANAAHVPAIIRRPTSHDVALVGRTSGLPLGVVEDTSYLEERHALDAGDVIVLMTDGTLEALDPDLLGMGQVTRFVSEAAVGARGVHDFLLRKYEQCTGGQRADDMTLLTLEAAPRSVSDGVDWDRAS
jgi:serine phosphatase RsbU (regulator of sigma subunit)